METRPFGRTGHNSTVAIFGAYALSNLNQNDADKIMEKLMADGVNHIDVAPFYGKAEERLGPFLASNRDRFFLGCKTMERTKESAAAELRQSLQHLKVEYLDLYQLHSVNSIERLDQVTGVNGALEAIIEARQQGLVRNIGITGHIPATQLEALNRFDFDSISFPYNPIQASDKDYRCYVTKLLQKSQDRNVGVMVIKSIAKGNWNEKHPTKNTWYEPLTDPDEIQQAVNFALSLPITGICTVGDSTLLSIVIEACRNFTRLNPQEQESLIDQAMDSTPMFPGQLPVSNK